MGLDHDGEIRSEDADYLNNQPLHDYTAGASLSQTGRLNTQGAPSQGLSHYSEQRIEETVNRLFGDA